jgi:hypothetical protein
MVLLLLVADRLPRAERLNMHLVLFGVLAALLYLTRPHQIPYVLILTGWRVLPLLRRNWAAWLPGVALGLAVCAAAIAFQAAIHRMNVGTAALIAHGQHDHPWISGHFDLTNPHFGTVLFSPARGLFWVTPVVAVALAGYVVRFRAVPWWGWASLSNAIVETSILAFWSDPGQGASFGIRLWAELVPVVACGLALWAGFDRRVVRIAAAATVGACVTWTLLMAICYILDRVRVDMTHSDVLFQMARTAGVWR